jgi:hypothetical protein
VTLVGKRLDPVIQDDRRELLKKSKRFIDKNRHTSSPRGTPLVKRKTRCTIVRCTLFGSKKIRNKRLEKIEFGKMLWKIIRKVGDLVEDGL